MKAWGNAMVIGLSAAAIFLADCPTAAGHQPMPPERIRPDGIAALRMGPTQIDALVRDLGSDEFVTREKASRRLIELGIVTREALERAAGGPDAEVRARARAILVQVCQSDFRHRLEAFSADYDGSHKQSLPAWDQFSSQFGASRLARQMFVDMQRAEPELLEALAQGVKTAGEVLAERSQQILSGNGEELSSLGTLASLLFVASVEGVAVDELGSMNLYPYAVRATYQQTSKSPLWPGVLKKIAGRWITKDNTPAVVNQNLIFAAQLELKDEALAVAARVLSSDDSLANSRQIAILLLGRFGDKSHRATLEKLLTDATSCGMVPTDKPPHQVELQIRDVALAVLLQMTEQDLRQYGLPSAQPWGPTFFQVGTLWFANPQAREAALAKWAKWRAEHPDS
ncbi:MAG: hypothetical protein WD063_21480 [Pirellulales bacterium]